MRALTSKDDGMLDDKVAFTPYTIENDAFDVRRFDELKAHSSKLLKSEEAGLKEYDQYAELQQDMYSGLFKADPVVNEDWKIKREFLLNKKITESIMESPKFKELRVMTTHDVVNATVGTELLSEESLKLVKDVKEQRDALQKLIDAGKQMDQAQQALDTLKTGINPAQGDPTAPRQSTAEIELEEAQRLYEEAMDKFQELTEEKQFQTAVNKMLVKVRDEVRETSEMISNWGLESSGSWQRKSAHEKMELLNKLRNSSKLKKIAEMAGRYRRLAAMVRKERIKRGMDEIYSVTQGGDLSRILPSEMLRFLDESTEDKAALDLIEGRMMQYEIRGKQKKGKGPIVICIDSSGSMDGTPEIWAKSVAMALLEIAREQKRDFYCIHFSSGWRGNKMHTNEFLKGEGFDIEKVVDMAEYFEGGGTEFEPPLDAAREKIGNDKKYQKADIVFITDGQSAVRDAWLVQFKEWKKENKVNIYSVLIDSYDNAISTLRQFSDKVDKLSNIKDAKDGIAMDLFMEI